jgi:hypothetical protein
MLPLPLQFLAAWLAVWLGRVLQQRIDYLVAENRLLREKLGGRKLMLTDAERRRLAVLGKELGGRCWQAWRPSQRQKPFCGGIASWWSRSTMAARGVAQAGLAIEAKLQSWS